jgi:hypothetical protein
MGDVTRLPPARTSAAQQDLSALEDICVKLAAAIDALNIVDSHPHEEGASEARAYLINEVVEINRTMKQWWEMAQIENADQPT